MASNGDFCLRCHSPVGGNLGESPFTSNLDRHPASREGITCIVCHRINKAYNKGQRSSGHGRRRLDRNSVSGRRGNDGMKRILAKPNKFRVVTNKKESRPQDSRKRKRSSKPIKSSTFCGSCHDVTLFNGFRLGRGIQRVSPVAGSGQGYHLPRLPHGQDSGQGLRL